MTHHSPIVVVTGVPPSVIRLLTLLILIDNNLLLKWLLSLLLGVELLLGETLGVWGVVLQLSPRVEQLLTGTDKSFAFRVWAFTATKI